jgi:hypothetical protein
LSVLNEKAPDQRSAPTRSTLFVWRLMEAPLGTSRFARLLESYRLATKQPPPPGLVLVHNQLSGPPLRQGKSFRAWWAKPAAEIVPPTLVTITASTDPARSFGPPRDTE